MNLELRILNGLHRGAALPLDGSALALGADETADVVLADPGLAARHARLLPGSGAEGESAWRLEAVEGEVFGPADMAAQAGVGLDVGGCARLDTVWICVSPLDAAWQAAPAPAVAADVPALSAAPPQAPARTRRQAKPLLKRLILLPFGVLIVLCAATAYALSARPVAPAAPVAARAGAPEKTHTAAPAPLTSGELRRAFQRTLAEGQMLDRFELALGETAWHMRADLDDEEKARFERLLKRFLAAHDVRFPVDARIVPSAALLPFKIEQVLSGEHAGVVTADGKRLFVGDEYRGTRLVSLKDNRLVFAGKRRIEVNW